MHFRSIAIFLCLTTAALSAPVSESQGVDQDITKSCKQFGLQKGYILEALCQDDAGTFAWTEFAMDEKEAVKCGVGAVVMVEEDWVKCTADALFWMPLSAEAVLQVGQNTTDGAIAVTRTVNFAEIVKNVNGQLTLGKSVSV